MAVLSIIAFHQSFAIVLHFPGSIYVEHITKWHEQKEVLGITRLEKNPIFYLICIISRKLFCDWRDWYAVAYLPVEVTDYTTVLLLL